MHFESRSHALHSYAASTLEVRNTLLHHTPPIHPSSQKPIMAIMLLCSYYLSLQKFYHSMRLRLLKKKRKEGDEKWTCVLRASRTYLPKRKKREMKNGRVSEGE